MDKVEVLKKAKALIDTPDKWCRQRNGRLLSNGKYQYCAIGAIMKVLEPSSNTFLECYNYSDLLKPHILEVDPLWSRWKSDSTSITWFNDNHSHAEVMRLFDLAIKEAENEMEQR